MPRFIKAWSWTLIALLCVALGVCIVALVTSEEKIEEKAGCILWGSGWSVVCSADKDE